MAVKVGNSWVSEAAYNYAKQSAESAQSKDGALQGLSEKFSEVNFSTNTAPYQGKGTRNIAIAPNILRQMESNPEKRLEYEALIYDCTSVQKSLPNRYGDSKLVGHGFIIDSNGSLSAWSITQSGGEKSRSSCLLPKQDKSSWFGKMLGGLQDASPAAIYQRSKNAAL